MSKLLPRCRNNCRGHISGSVDLELPDLLTDIPDKTQLTRRSLVRILTESNRLNDFKKNPQQFIDQSADAINFPT